MNISFIYGFFTGCFVTVIGRHCLQKFINPQQCSELIDTKKVGLDKLFNDYPDFMNTIKEDLTASNCKTIREFFVVDKDAILNSSIPRLRYELSAEILPALNRLESLGYIEKLKNNCLHYKIEEDFVSQLKQIISSDSYDNAIKDDGKL
ncbi:hypothetical protein Lgra_2172 [Legionella gratiana]|uniref:Uncharacterized protein n=1 Tax=Legionella gratiana TaxID=45066 RepID=A0A378JFT5_9GAMM|nr:hypothetical protein [Legionella gratiana]KTD08937.1 hypothetical protein Lgra_2172 [Legionella gratiana]STX45851.1 Uncharacterised protein [Legionella gratiana]